MVTRNTGCFVPTNQHLNTFGSNCTYSDRHPQCSRFNLVSVLHVFVSNVENFRIMVRSASFVRIKEIQ